MGLSKTGVFGFAAKLLKSQSRLVLLIGFFTFSTLTAFLRG